MKIFAATLFALTILAFVALYSAPANPMPLTIAVGNARIDVSIESGQLTASEAQLSEWVRSAAESVAAYYGRYPLDHVSIRIAPTDGQGVRNGRTFGRDGGFISIHVGDETTASDLNKDWMMTHEMVHLAFPSVPEKNHWIEEGIATYVEPIARVQAKHMDVNEMWFELVRDLHQGLPAPGDKGLDHTHTWGRTYWGGALFCLLADVEIRRQTNNRKGLQDALRGILDAGGDIRRDWELEKALTAGDQATGTTALMNLYAKMKDSPYEVDLPALWTQLGVVRDSNTVHFDDSAPLAATRKAITYGKLTAPSTSAALQRPSATIAGRTAAKARP
ncbi:MAG: hypothetical protein WB780_13730 [Candidatus Acidiferrales bacterium]